MASPAIELGINENPDCEAIISLEALHSYMDELKTGSPEMLEERWTKETRC